MADDIAITIRTRGGRQSAQDARQVATAIGTISPAARRAASAVGTLGRESARAGSRGFSLLRNQAQYAGFAIGGIGALAIRSGLQFNSTMEQNQIAFQAFLGSAQAARNELALLQKMNLKTPFQLPDLVTGVKRLLGFNFRLKDANSLVMQLSDVAAGTSTGAEGIDRLVTAIGQIRGKGTLQMEELRQLQEIPGAIDFKDLAKRLHLTAGEMGNVGQQGISASKAIRAIRDQWAAGPFRKIGAEQAGTFSVQVSNLSDSFNRLMGTITKPAFNRLKRDILPALGDLGNELNRTWGGTATTDMKLFASREQIRRALKPLEEEVGQLHLGRRFGEAVDAAAPAIGRAFGRAAPHAAGAFFDAWKASGPWVQLGTVALGALKLASFVARGAAMGRGFRLGWGTGVGTLPTPVGAPVPGIPGGRGRAPRVGRVGRATRTAGRALPLVGTGIAVAEGINLLAPRPGESGNPEGVRAHGPRLPRGQSYWERTHPTRVPRVRAGAIPPIHLRVDIDGKQVAHAVHRHASDAKASRRGG